MKLIFAGTPEFAASALAALLQAGHAVELVLTQPDRPAGRGMKAVASPVKQLAMQHGLTVLQPPSLKDPQAQMPLRECDTDIMVVAAYGLILPQAVLDLPRLGAINIHASLLPRWRGAAPIQRAILAGDTETGISIMRMDAGLDTGPVLMQKAVPITEEDTAQSLHDKLAALGASLIVEALSTLTRAGLAEQPQPVQGVTYASKLDKSEARIDWALPAQQVHRAIRAFSPFPGAHSALRGAELKLWKATPSALPAGLPATPAGTVLAADATGIRVACGDGMLIIQELQRPGARRLPAAEFLRGFPVVPGDCFGS